MVTYRGNAVAIQDLVSGQIDLMFVEQSIMMGHLASGSIKAYAILAKSGSAAVPEVPTIEEAGGPPLHIVTWRGMWVPKETPAGVRSKLSSAMLDAVSIDCAKRIAEVGQEVGPLAPDAAGACRAPRGGNRKMDAHDQGRKLQERLTRPRDDECGCSG